MRKVRRDPERIQRLNLVVPEIGTETEVRIEVSLVFLQAVGEEVEVAEIEAAARVCLEECAEEFECVAHDTERLYAFEMDRVWNVPDAERYWGLSEHERACYAVPV